MKPIPISAAERIAKEYGYDQVMVIARKVGNDPDPHGEHVTTYGTTKAHCEVAARAGDYLKYKVMGWASEGGEIRLTAEDIRSACSDAVYVFADEPEALKCKEAVEYMREVLLAAVNQQLTTDKESLSVDHSVDGNNMVGERQQ